MGGLRLGRVAGVELYLDWSVAIIFALVLFGLGGGVLPRWHPDWAPALHWAVAAVAAVAFFASILIHELSHAVVAHARGLQVPRITLFIFGGLAHMQGEPAEPKTELLMAAAGPLTSIVIGCVATFIGFELTLLQAGTPATPDELVHMAGPIATIFLWLGPINVMLGVFNLIPGFPLDGGRVLRAVLWWSTHDMDKATRVASLVGRAFGWALIVMGALMAFGLSVPFFGTGLMSGLWLALIGWFLHNAALRSYVELRLRRRLASVKVRDVMRTRLDTVRSDMSIAELVSEHVMNSDQTSFPVVDGPDLIGIVTTRDIRRVPGESWQSVSVGDLITPAESVPSIEVDAAATTAMETLVRDDLEQLPVIDHGHLSGFVRRQDILKWLTLQPDPR